MASIQETKNGRFADFLQQPGMAALSGGLHVSNGVYQLRPEEVTRSSFVFYIPTSHLSGHAGDGLSDLVGICGGLSSSFAFQQAA